MRLFYALTVIAFFGLGLGVWDMIAPGVGPFYDVAIAIITQGILMIWCLRDLYKRRFPDQRTHLNWFAAFLFLGVFTTTAYLLLVKRRQWSPGE